MGQAAHHPVEAWCQSRAAGAEAQAEDILQRMRTVEQRGLGGHVQQGGVDVRHYNKVLARIATSGKANAGAEAERLLAEVIALSKQEQRHGETETTPSTAARLAPNSSSFNAVITAYANAGGRNNAQHAQRILSMMEEPASVGLQAIATQIIPDRSSYTKIFMAWANTRERNVDAGERVEELLGRMSAWGEKKRGVTPDTVAYNAILRVWSVVCIHNADGIVIV